MLKRARLRLNLIRDEEPGEASGPVAGVDEAGRGCLAGPVVAAAVILPENHGLSGLVDSKKLTAIARWRLAAQIQARAIVGVGIVWQRRIEKINILNASLEAMARALAKLAMAPTLALIDGDKAISPEVLASHWRWPAPLPRQLPIIHGDSLEPCIEAASIMAKTSRDALMERFARRWPLYGFERHKGYGVKAHYAALAKFGPCPLHRLTYRGVMANGTDSLVDKSSAAPGSA